MAFHFPKSGVWNGNFVLGGPDSVDSGFQMPANGLEFQSPFFRCSDTSTQFFSGYGTCGSDPLTSGYVTVNGTTVHFSLTGAAPNASYTTHYCGGQSQNGCPSLGILQTDSSGNGAINADYIKTIGQMAAPSIFYLSRDEGSGASRAEFGSAFKVP